MAAARPRPTFETSRPERYVFPSSDRDKTVSTTAYYVIAFAIGIVAAVHLPLNGRFASQVGSPLLATAIFFSVGAFAAITIWIFFGRTDVLGRLSQAEIPLFAPGIVSFGIILCATFFIPRMGPGAYFVCLVSGQVVTGLLLSHFGFFAAERLPLTPLKIFGAAAILLGLVCIRLAERTSVDGPVPPRSMSKASADTVR